ncbi:MAG: DUF721 domain-containing protein [Bosea sp. (in: a-proteobacteria)]
MMAAPCDVSAMQAFTPNRRRPAARPLADMIGAAMSPALAAKGFAGRELIGNWAGIIGTRLAARSRPLKIDWPKRPGQDGDRAEPATLVVLVESAFAPELQHAAPLLMARINAHLGWPAVGKVVLKQGPVQPEGRLKSQPEKPLADAKVAEVRTAAGRITEPGLKDAVTRLGLAISRKAAKTGENV